jgi:hypothetical protein
MNAVIKARLQAAAKLAGEAEAAGNRTKFTGNNREEAWAAIAHAFNTDPKCKNLEPHGANSPGQLCEFYKPGTPGRITLFQSNIVVFGGKLVAPTADELTDQDFKDGEEIQALAEATVEALVPEEVLAV